MKSENKYHINPATGIPSICRATVNKCPYGGSTGQENHYKTYSEAQIASQKALSNKHILLPSSDNLSAKEIDRIEKEYAEVAWEPKSGMPKDEMELEKELITTNDTHLLKGIIEGKTYVEEDWSKISLALQNPNLSRDFIDEILNNPDDYNIDTQRWLMLNPALRHEDIMYVVDNHSDLATRTLALKNPSLDKKFAEDFLENREDELNKVPWYAMTHNLPLVRDRVFTRYQIKCNITHIKGDEDYMADLRKTHQDWWIKYENSK